MSLSITHGTASNTGHCYVTSGSTNAITSTTATISGNSFGGSGGLTIQSPDVQMTKAMAAKIAMIAITIINSISEKPLDFLMVGTFRCFINSLLK